MVSSATVLSIEHKTVERGVLAPHAPHDSPPRDLPRSQLRYAPRHAIQYKNNHRPWICRSGAFRVRVRALVCTFLTHPQAFSIRKNLYCTCNPLTTVRLKPPPPLLVLRVRALHRGVYSSIVTVGVCHFTFYYSFFLPALK